MLLSFLDTQISVKMQASLSKGGNGLRNYELKLAVHSAFLGNKLCSITKGHVVMQLQETLIVIRRKIKMRHHSNEMVVIRDVDKAVFENIY